MNQNSESDRQDVKSFFQGYAVDFYDIYTGNSKSKFAKFLDKKFRHSMFLRFEKSYEIIRELNGSSILDIGCGPGTHDVALASLLKIQVTGIDVASSMVDLARNEAEKAKVSHLCNFLVDDFITYQFTEMYDAALSVGVVEYITDPGPFIRKMFDLSTKKVIFSLPVKWHYLTPQRILRYKLRKCPLHFYSKKEIENLLLNNGMHNFSIHNLGRDYLIEVNR